MPGGATCVADDARVWMWLLLVVPGTWAVVSLLTGMVIGRSIATANGSSETVVGAAEAPVAPGGLPDADGRALVAAGA